MATRPYGDGCQYYPHCLECPFPDCVADKAGRVEAEVRRLWVKELWNEGKTKTEIATILGVTERQVYRLLT